ncbi:MAG: hypothetical protein V1866_01820 [archaeon]
MSYTIAAITKGASIKIRVKGLFDFEGVYKLIADWIINSRQMEFHETRYKDKVETAFGNELKIETMGERRVSEFIKYYIYVKYELWEAKEVKVVIDGKPVKRMQGRMHIEIKGDIVADWQNRFKKYPKLMGFLIKTVFKNELEVKHADPLEHDMHAFAAKIKRFLNIDAE